MRVRPFQSSCTSTPHLFPYLQTTSKSNSGGQIHGSARQLVTCSDVSKVGQGKSGQISGKIFAIKPRFTFIKKIGTRPITYIFE
ncbi:hypothetical protein CANTEDRAFT_112879 [Yamadazyma tenuis ATCC 10573]|uniref:Uncharacterized protein n=1 Tax=Candida tenuis (strain ATCC 10573 / BCRC 21748 / CBS 615 / JCM 9827 / NBRC 10315 / NRRL Y-1498 / VKM Y-70) TaxID=590646 RepID=G3AZ62_CANTC|nr:uncharacterized protein CANTEDRAFT_112879 [Yamadazyma tenuis ATCC 10573]EGV66017.1 hypothetical protein CANTEDRAFT_112879 [Yamadazyma tenuis ATCC 10573]